MAESNAAHEKERVQERVKAAVTAYRVMLDTFVNNPERRIASEAEQARPRQSQGAQSQSTNAP
jgi:cytochrome c-type biogenesis protein CcmH/NrfG